MKNILKTSLIILLSLVVFTNCKEENEVKPLGYYISVISTSGTASAFGLEGKSVKIPLQLKASQGIASLDVDGTSIEVKKDEKEQEVTYTYDVPADTKVGTKKELTFTLKDNDANSAKYVFTVNTTEDPIDFVEVGQIDLGNGEGAAEISAYDKENKQLFVINNDDQASNNKLDVLDIQDPTNIKLKTSVDLSTYGGGANSVAVSNGKLAVAVQANTKTDNGVILVWKTSDLKATPTKITVGALPDMVTFSPNGKWILVANEGEPNDDYTTDPEGTISIIDSETNAVSTASFTSFNAKEADLEKKGFRVFGPNASLAQDVEPEYIAVSSDSKTAYVTLQENNGVAVVDIATAKVSEIVPLGFKDYTKLGNEIDPSDKDSGVFPRLGVSFKMYGVYQPDAIAIFNVDEKDYLITANEGDSREYEGTPGYVGEKRVEDVTLDATAFPDASDVQKEENFGRLKMMLDLGDTDGDDDYDAIYSYGARSFSVWSSAGSLVFDSGNELDQQAIASGVYTDKRSDDKSIEPEGVTTGKINDKTYAFIGLERVNAVAMYDVTTPTAPSFVKMIKTGVGPEGLVFIPASESPNDKSLLIVSCEVDGTVRMYQVGN